MDSLVVPPLPFLELWRADRRPRRAQPLPAFFPAELERTLTQIARDAVRAGVDPVLGAADTLSEEAAKPLLDQSFRAFVAQRNRIWPPIIEYLRDTVQHNPLVLLRLLREVSSRIRSERLKIPVPTLNEDDPSARSLLRLRLALRTYEMTLDLAMRSFPTAIAVLSSGRVPPEFADPKAFSAFLDHLDMTTAGLEFGTLVSIRLLESPALVQGPVFDLATEYALQGADGQHVFLRGIIRSIIGEEPAAGPDTAHEAAPGLEPPPEALLADWVRAVLAA